MKALSIVLCMYLTCVTRVRSSLIPGASPHERDKQAYLLHLFVRGRPGNDARLGVGFIKIYDV